MNSNIDKDHEQKGSKRLNQFKVNNLDKSFIDTCRKTNLDAYTKYLRHIRVNNDTSGCIYTDKDKIVAILNTEIKKNGMIWIQALEIAEEYQGYGLSKQLLLIATKKYNAKYLSVDKNNKVAIDIYEKFGFHEYHKTDNMIFMCIGEPNEVEEAVVNEAMQLSMFRKDVIKSKSSDKDDPYDKITIKYYSSNKIAATVTITKYDNGDNFIHDLEVYYPYKRQGLSYQILDVATKEYGGNCLFVKADNKIAIHVYEKYGFKKTNENYEGKKDGLKGYVMRLSSTVNEGYIFDSKDIYYNKDKFDSGEVNLCFITGASGSGKSTMAHKLESKDIEVYELDDVIWNKIKFTMDNFKEYGDLIYSFFKGPGKKFYLGEGEKYSGGDNYERDAIQSFVKYAISYANSHKDKKFILEGVWIAYNDNFQPQELKDYAVFIKGTSSLKSTMRGIKRDHSDDTSDKFSRTMRDIKALIKRSKHWAENEKSLSKWRKYYGNKSE